MRTPPEKQRSPVWLPPIGRATPDIECLSSYLQRLAAASEQPPGLFMAESLAPLIGKRYPTVEASKLLDHLNVASLNGFGTIAADWAQALARLSGKTSLQWLTLLPWAAVFPPQGFLRPTRAWCPACYAEWHAQGYPLYDKLVWVFQVISWCPRHKCPLITRCPAQGCHLPIPWLSWHARLGECPSCKGALMQPEGSVPLANKEESEYARQHWVHDAIGQLLAAAPHLSSYPRRDQVFQVIAAIIEQRAQSIPRFAESIGVPVATVRHWRSARYLPRLEPFLRMCYQYRLTPLACLTQPSVLVPTHLPSLPLPVSRQAGKPGRSALQETEQLRTALEAFVADKTLPPPSVRQVAQRLGTYTGTLYRHFPDLCHILAARYQADRRQKGEQRLAALSAQVRAAAARLAAEGEPMTWHRLRALLPSPGIVRDSRIRAVWEEERRKFQS